MFDAVFAELGAELVLVVRAAVVDRIGDPV
jgi:hypothetical protein